MVAVVVGLLWRPLRDVLSELSTSPGRARFWHSVYLIWLVALPFCFSLFARPDGRTLPPSLASAVAAHLLGALMGVVVAVLFVALCIATMSRAAPAITRDDFDDLQRLLIKV